MNKRIQELDKQAKLWAMDNTNFPISSHIPAGYTEKFAELIVRECLKIAKNREDDLESAGLLSESNAVGNVSYRISRQFGVKR